MYAVTMETATRGVEASVSQLMKGSGRLFWLSKVRMPLVRRRLLQMIRLTNQKFARSNIALMELTSAIKFDGAGQIDADLNIRDTLESIKHDAIAFRTSVLDRRRNFGSDEGERRIAKEMDQTIALSCEMFELANGLQWQIAEHDADFAPHHDGFVATTADELTSLLSKF